MEPLDGGVEPVDVTGVELVKALFDPTPVAAAEHGRYQFRHVAEVVARGLRLAGMVQL